VALKLFMQEVCAEAKDQAKVVSEPLAQLQDSSVVSSITRYDNAIAALKGDGSVVSWGLRSTNPCHTVQQGVYGAYGMHDHAEQREQSNYIKAAQSKCATHVRHYSCMRTTNAYKSVSAYTSE
jgi:hypothetical protein